MKNWNRTGKIKAIILALVAIPNLIAPVEVHEGPGMIYMPFLFGCFAIPLIIKFNGTFLKREIIKPTWNDNPLTLKRPLAFFHFAAFFFMAVGLSMVLGTVIKFQTLSFMGLTSISFGLGILIGIEISLKWTKSKG